MTTTIGGAIFEPLVKQDLNLGYGTTLVTMPAGGQASGDKIGIHTFLPQIYNCKDFGAQGDGASDDTAAIQATLDAAVGAAANDGGGGVIYLPDGGDYVCASSLDLSDAFNLYVVGAGARLIYTGAGSHFINLASAQRVRFDGVKIHYTHAGFTGNLVTMGASGGLASDPAYCEFNFCEFAGIGVSGAAAFVDCDRLLASAFRSCKFVGANCGLLIGTTNYTNILLIDTCTFRDMGACAAAMNSTQSITFQSCTFEPTNTRKSAGIRNPFSQFSYGFNVRGCWFGDVAVDGGGPWIEAHSLGMVIDGNFFGTAGSGAGDCSLDIESSQGLVIQGNRFEGPVNIAVGSTGGQTRALWIAGNDFQGTMPLFGMANLANSQAVANNGLANFSV